MKQKRLDFEILRLIAIIFVVFNHTQNRGFELFLQDGCQGINYYLSLVLSVLCVTGVPLFLLVSGGLLLHKNETIHKVLFGRVLRILVVLVLFSAVLYGFWYRWDMLESYSLNDFLSRLWHQGISIPYWYLYAYGALLLALPLLRPMVMAMRDSTFMYLTFLYVMFHSVMQPLGYILGWGTVDPDFHIPMVTSVVYYFIMGYFFAQRFHWESLTWRHIGILTAASCISVLFSCVLCGHSGAVTGEAPNTLRDGFVILPAITLYLGVGLLTRTHPVPEKLGKVIASLGGCVFGVYLLEGILRVELQGIYHRLEPVIHVLPACFVWVLAVVAVGLAITWILKRIPGLRKII